ncbi:MAG: YfhO family protein [Cyclonatronaceae bacterium]
MAKNRRETSSKRTSRKTRKKSAPAPSITNVWEKIPLKYRHLIVLIFLLIVPSFIFSEVYFGGQQFVAHDIEQFRASAQSVIEYQEETGEDALWATNIFSGMPSYTVISNKAFTHLDTLLRRAFSALFIPVFPFIICLSGVYFFFWLMGYRPLPSALAALGICLTTYIPIIVGAGHNSKLIAYSFIPWVMAGYWMLSRSEKRLAGLFLFAIALNLTLRSEHIQILYYFLFPLGIWFIYDSVTALRSGSLSVWSRRAALMITAGLLALAANIQPYWSIYEYSHHSIRGGSELQQDAGAGSGLDIDYAFAWSQGRAELLTLIIPDSFGGSSADGTYWGPKSFTSGPHYMGAIVFLMFLIGLVRAPNKLKYVFLGSGLLAMLFSLGNNLFSFNYLFFHYMPLFNKFRTPEMWLIVTVFSFSIIAAMGMKWVYDSWMDGTLTLRSLYLPGGIVLGLALFFAVFTGSLLSFEKEGERQQMAEQVAAQQNMRPDDPQVRQFVNRYIEQDIKPLREEKAVSDSRRFFLYVALGGGVLTLTALGIVPAGYTLAGLLLLTAVDLVQVGNRYVDKSGLVPSHVSSYDVVARQVRSIDRYIEQHNRDGQSWPWRSFPLGDSPFSNAVPAAFVYPSIGGYSGAKLSSYQDIIDHAIYGGEYGLNLQVLNMLNTRFLTYPDPINLPGLDVVYEGDEGVVMENRNVLPKAWFADSLVAAPLPRDAITELNRFDASSTAILMDTDPLPNITPTNNRSVEVTSYGPREIVMTVSADASSFLVLSEIYYPEGWHATLDDEPIDILRTNYILRGFEIPPGEHVLTLRFDPRSHILGSRLSWIFNILILLIGVWALYAHFKNSAIKNGES